MPCCLARALLYSSYHQGRPVAPLHFPQGTAAEWHSPWTQHCQQRRPAEVRSKKVVAGAVVAAASHLPFMAHVACNSLSRAANLHTRGQTLPMIAAGAGILVGRLLANGRDNLQLATSISCPLACLLAHLPLACAAAPQQGPWGQGPWDPMVGPTRGSFLAHLFACPPAACTRGRSTAGLLGPRGWANPGPGTGAWPSWQIAFRRWSRTGIASIASGPQSSAPPP